MTQKLRTLFSFSFVLATLLVVGCDLSGSSSDNLSSEVDAAIAAAEAEAQPSNTGESRASEPAPSTASTSSSSSGGGSGGFLWKPVSESDGNLVVLLPGSLRGKVSGASILKGGSVVEKGRFAGDTHNGNRPHYRFSKPGAAYGSGLQVVANVGGGTQAWSVPNGSSRTSR